MKIRDVTNYPVMAEGGEGILYEYGDRVLKWYKPCVDLAAKSRKVQLLLDRKLPLEAVAPMEAVFDRRRNFCGYVMKKVAGEEFRMLSNRRFVSANHITTKEILQLLVRVKAVLEKLHSQKIYVGDLNDRNLLFDRQYNVYFIDCDSWSVGEERCRMAMDLFLDPKLAGNDFNEETDTYAFCVLAFKALTRVHPFGGTMDPDRNLRERMEKGLSVIDRPEVKLPRSVRSWRNLSPDLLKAMKDVFEHGARHLGSQLEDLLSDLKYCDRDQDYYYGKYQTCPLCDEHAGILNRPVFRGVMDGLTLTALWDRRDVRTVLNITSYMDRSGQVVDVKTGKKTAYVPGQRYYFTPDGRQITEESDRFTIRGREEHVFRKRFRSRILTETDRIYYLNLQGSLGEVTVYPQGNQIRKLCACGNTAYFEAALGHYCVVNVYDGRLIIKIDGFGCELRHEDEVRAYGIHYDPAEDDWLIVLEGAGGAFRTLVLSRTSVRYDTTEIRYPCDPSHLCIYHGTIFLPMDGKIRGYAYQKGAFKDFTCEAVDTDSRLLRKGRGFYIINQENVYLLK